MLWGDVGRNDEVWRKLYRSLRRRKQGAWAGGDEPGGESLPRAGREGGVRGRGVGACRGELAQGKEGKQGAWGVRACRGELAQGREGKGAGGCGLLLPALLCYCRRRFGAAAAKGPATACLAVLLPP